MNALHTLEGLIAQNRLIQLVEKDIYSVLPNSNDNYHYDKRAALYDLIVGSNLYHRLMWGTTSQSYTEFAKQAIRSIYGGKFIDAGCGSLLFTAQVYLENNRQVIAFDQSLGMLRRARKRLINMAGCVPEHIILLQADLQDIPFRRGTFDTCLSMNVVHMFDDADGLIRILSSQINESGHLFITSLIRSGRLIGDQYLSLLSRMGEVGRPHSKCELKETMEKYLARSVRHRVVGNMLYATTVV